MAYQRHEWKPRIGVGLNKYLDNISGDMLELISTPDSITQEGTPFNALWLNQLEQGVVDNRQTYLLDNVPDATLDSTQGIMVGDRALVRPGPSTLTFQNHWESDAFVAANYQMAYSNNVGDPVLIDHFDGTDGFVRIEERDENTAYGAPAIVAPFNQGAVVEGSYLIFGFRVRVNRGGVHFGAFSFRTSTGAFEHASVMQPGAVTLPVSEGFVNVVVAVTIPDSSKLYTHIGFRATEWVNKPIVDIQPLILTTIKMDTARYAAYEQRMLYNIFRNEQYRTQYTYHFSDTAQYYICVNNDVNAASWVPIVYSNAYPESGRVQIPYEYYEGRPVYQQTFWVDAWPNNTTAADKFYIEYCAKFLGVFGGYATDGTLTYMLNESYANFQVWKSGASLQLRTTANRTTFSGPLIVRYTRTTDTPDFTKSAILEVM